LRRGGDLRGLSGERRSYRSTALTLAVIVGLLLPLLPQGVRANGETSKLTVRVTIGSFTINPNLTLTLGVDKSIAIPGDLLTYAGQVTHTGITACLPGTFSAQNTGTATATIADFFDEIDEWDPNQLKWIPLVGYVNTRTAYVPIVTPLISTGITLTATSIPANGVTYPSSGDPVIGTTIAPNATAAWNGSACIRLSAAQIHTLANATSLRVQGHMEDTPGDPAGESWTDNAQFPNPFQSGFLNANNVAVTVTPPSGPTVQITSSTVPAFTSLAPGGSVNYAATYNVPTGTPRGSNETELAYLNRLTGLEALSLKASASVTATGPTGNVSANAPPVTTTEHVPIVTINKSGPATVTAGTTATYPLNLKNAGGAPASGITVADTTPGGPTGSVTGAPTALAPNASSTNTQATFAVPASQAQGNLTDTAIVNWQDANQNPYGQFSSAFTTVVLNPLLGAKFTLSLPPGNAGLNPINGSQLVLITLINSAGAPIPNQSVTVSITGANPGVLTTTTDNNGQATISFTGKASGVDQLQATASAASLTIQSNTLSVTWILPIQPISTTPVQGNFYAESASAQTFVAQPGDPAAFQQTFPTINFNPPANIVPHNVSGVGPTTTPFTDITTDAVGNFAGTISAQGNGVQAGLGTLTNFDAVFTANFVVSQPQDVTFQVMADDGFILGVGGGATRVRGTLQNPPASGFTAFNGYLVVGAYNLGGVTAPGTYPVTVHFPSAGSYPYEIDYSECCSSQLSLTMTVVSVNTGPYNLFTGYADTIRPAGTSTFPFPWNGAANTTFMGSGAPYDTGGLRFDNNTNQPITLNHVTVDIGTHHYDPWNLNLSVPANATLILAGASGAGAFNTSEANGLLKSGSGGGSSGFTATQWATGFGSCGGVGPVGVAFDSTGNLFVMNYCTGFLYKFGPGGGAASPATQVNANAIYGSPAGLAFSKDGKHLYTVRRGSNDVLELDQASGNVLRTIATNVPAATGVATDPLSGDLFVSEPNGGQGIVRIANPTSANPGPPVLYTATNADGIAFGPDGTLYGAVYGQGFAIINGTNTASPGTITTQVLNSQTLAGTDGIALLPPPAGSTVSPIVLNSNNGFIVEIDNPTTNPTYHNLVTGGSRGDFATVGPDGCLYATQTSSVEKVTASDGSCPFIPSICLPNPAIPQVHVTINGFTFNYSDSGQALNNLGIDGECNGTNESQAWQQIGGKGGPVNIPLPPATALALQAAPSNGHIVGQSQAFTVAAMDGAGHTVPNLAVQLGVFGANPQQLSGTTDANGTATFSYTGSNAGSDTVTATAFLSGLRSVSNAVPIQWTIPAPGGPIPGASGPAPPSVVITAPADGSAVSQPVAVTATIRAPPSSPISSWSATYQSVSGGTPTILASGNGNPPASLANFDPTGLVPGTYAISVNAATAAGGGATAVSRVIVGNGGGTAAQAPPTMSAPSPADGTIVTKPVAVTASITPPSGQTIASWSVAYQSQNQGTTVPIASGNGSPPTPLATFDPTLLVNDTYGITVSATASGGGIQAATTTVAVSGTLKLGRYVTAYQDMSVPVGGFQMEVRRVYDSIDKRAGDFGIGWHVELANFRVGANRQLGAGGWTEYPTSCIFGLCFYAFKSSTPHNVTVTFPDQHQEIFDFTPLGGAALLYWQGSAAFTARPGRGITSTLEVSGDSSLSYDFAGNLVGSSGYFNPTRFKLTTRDGRVLILDTTLGLVSETDPNGNAMTVDANGVHGTLGPASSPTTGPSITFARDSQGRITDINGPVTGQHYHYVYFQTVNELQAVTNPMGNTGTYSYDPLSGNLQKSLDPNNHPLQTLNYDANGRLVSIANGNQPATTITTSPGAQQQTVADPNGKLSTVLTYDDMGDVIERDDVFGGKTLKSTFAYDAVGRPTSVTDPLNNTGAIQYDQSTGNVLAVSSAGRTWGLENYNNFGEPGLIRKPDGTVQLTFTYDPKTGAVGTEQQPGANPTTFTYYAAGQLKSVADPGGRSIAYTYDANGNLATISDSQGRTVKVSIDGGGQVHTVTDQIGNQTVFDHNPDGSLKAVTDALQHQWQYTYDSLGNIRQIIDPLTKTASFLYTDLGELQQKTDRNGQITTYGYDTDGLLTKITRPGNDIVNFNYDPVGRLIETDNAQSHIDRSYDDVTRPIAETTCANTGSPSTPCSAAPTGNQPTVTMTYAYFPDSQLKTVSSSDPAIPAAQYGYDPLGHLSSIQNGNQAPFTFGYDSAGRLSSLTRPNGIVDTFGYNASGDLVSRDATHNNAAVARFDYAIDPVTGRRSSATDNSGTTTYTYYDNGTLRSATHPAGSGIPNESYSYDAAGNRSTTGVSSTFDAADRIQSDGTFAYAFDAEGNVKNKTPLAGGSGTTYNWNADHQLLGITYSDGTSSSFRYDPFGRRIGATNKGQDTRFIYNGLSVHADYNSSNQLQASYVSGLEAVSASGQPSYYLSDGLGSVRGVSDASGTVTGTFDYGSFGVPGANNPSSPNRETFTGYQYDSTSGLYDAGARYYDASTGRFLSEDPLTSINPFPYAANDPVNSVDQNGLQAVAEYSILMETDANNAQCIAGVVAAIAGPAIAGAAFGLAGEPVSSDEVISTITVALVINGAVCAAAAATANPCSFRIVGWKNYPNWAKRPTGWMRPINGAEYAASDAAKQSANRSIRNAAGGQLGDSQIHEWQPTKFNGSPTDLSNKAALPPGLHSELTTWWLGLQLYLRARGCP
jgi:RHS repeat-associated protein/uncharacterized repeat protein (TIGR01451 family)